MLKRIINQIIKMGWMKSYIGCLLICVLFLAIQIGSSSAIVSDDFNAVALNTSIWTPFNPLGGGTFTMTGEGTLNASLNINVPGGISHDAWITNNAPRMMQVADNTDFQIEVKFLSAMTSTYQTQGIIIEQDSNNYIRFDFIGTSTNETYIYSANFQDGVPPTQRIFSLIATGNPLYLRVNRTGDRWKQFYSYDGKNWFLATKFRHELTVNYVGPFAANVGKPAPPFTAKIDYFFNSSSPVVPEDELDKTPPASYSFSDDFNSPTLNTSRWTVINPKGDATITVIGNGTGDAMLSIAVPAGQDHNPWTTNTAAGVMQSIDNKDFEIELKFQSRTTLPYQEQGLIIQQDSSNYIRFDFYSNSKTSATTNIFAASFASGKPSIHYNLVIPQSNTMYMKVNRTGDLWQQFYSDDGKNWKAAANFNYEMIVSSIGPFAGNLAGDTSPAFTSLVDYFFDSSYPIVPEDGLPIAPDYKFQHVIIDSEDVGADLKSVGDLNGDGYPDVIVADNSGTPLQWYEWPSWTKHVIDNRSVFTTDMQVASISGDGILDVIVPDFVNGQVLWYENPMHAGGDQTGTWTMHVIGSSKIHDVEVGDVNGDGKLDVLVRPHSGKHTLFLQNDPLSWTRVDIMTSTDGEGTSLGDIDRDGDLDIVGNGYWLECPDDPRNPDWAMHNINLNWPSLVSNKVADINKDGRLDVLIANSEDAGLLAWYEAPVNPKEVEAAWIEHIITPSVDYVHGILVADFDNDGDPDVAFSEMSQSARKRAGIFWNRGGGISWSLQVLSTTGSHNIRMGDIDRDGDLDIVGANYKDTSPVELWRNMLNNGTEISLDHWSYIALSTTHTRTFGLDFGDIDADGKTDVVSGSYWYRNPGGKMTDGWIRSVMFPNNIHAILVVDVDGDNFTDIIGQKTEGTNLDIYWLETNNPDVTSFTARHVASLPAASHPEGSQGFKIAQIEKGGRPEILISTRSAVGRGIYYLKIPSTKPEAGNWPNVLVNSNPSDEGFGIADIDGDGNPDIAATTGETKMVEWYRNPGNGESNWQAFMVGSFPEATFPDRVEVADLDGDGKPDIIATEENGLASDAETFWWKQPVNPMTDNWNRSLITSQGTTNNLAIADMNRDGNNDVILAEHKGTMKLAIWANNGNGLFDELVVSRSKESHLGAHIVDLDSDGDLDIVSIAWDAPQFIHLWRNDAIVLQP